MSLRYLGCLLVVFALAGAVRAEVRPAPPAISTEGTVPGNDRSEPPRAARSRIVFIVSRDCPKCREELARLRRPGGEFAALRSRGWKIGTGPKNHIQIVDRDKIPELVEQLAVREYPTVACVTDGEVVRSFKHGCTTPLDRWTFGWLIKGENERPTEAVLEEAEVESTGSYPLRGNHWSIDGEWDPPKATVVAHLRGENHAAQLDASWKIETWSYEELRSLHDDLHERELASQPAAYSSSPASGNDSSVSGFGASRKFFGR